MTGETYNKLQKITLPIALILMIVGTILVVAG